MQNKVYEKQWVRDGIKYTFTAYPENPYEIEEHFELKSDIDLIQSKVNNDEYSYFFLAELSAQFDDISELECSEYLGACSYKSFEEFLEDEACGDLEESVTKELMLLGLEIRDKLNKIYSGEE